jgi:glycosyltransferase involved in cell wall biosynthesis
VIATYGRPRQLGACLEALCALDYPRERFEVIVVDDGSPDPVAPVAEPHQDRLRLRVERTARGGPGAARNAGARLADGELLAFIDDDCLPAPGWLRGLAKVHQASPSHALGGRTLNALGDNPFSETTQLLNDVLYDHYNANGRGDWYFASNNMGVPADGFRAIEGFKVDLPNLEDRDLCERWAARGYGMSFAPEAVVQHAHESTLRGFATQHFSYGRGAHALSRDRAVRTGKPERPEVGLHVEFVRRALRRGARGPLLAALVLLSQAAYVAGFLGQRWRGWPAPWQAGGR